MFYIWAMTGKRLAKGSICGKLTGMGWPLTSQSNVYGIAMDASWHGRHRIAILVIEDFPKGKSSRVSTLKYVAKVTDNNKYDIYRIICMLTFSCPCRDSANMSWRVGVRERRFCRVDPSHNSWYSVWTPARRSRDIGSTPSLCTRSNTINIPTNT